MGVKATISAGPDLSSGNLDFGFTAGTTLCLTHYKLFQTAASTPTFVSALQESLEDYMIPAGIDDLAAMGVADIATVEGAGTLQFSGSINLLSAVNPLVSVSTGVLPGAINVKEGASVDVGASYAITGEFQIRVQKIGPGTVRLGIYKKRGADFQVQVTSAIGVSAGMGKVDFVSAVLGAISPAPFPSASEYEQMGLSDEKVDAIAGALKTAVQRRLELALESELYAGSSQGAAFLYEIDLSNLDPDGRAAVQQALKLDFSALAQPARSLPRGVREIQSVFTTIRDQGQTLRINLLGIYNYASVYDLSLQGSVFTDPASGEVVITDQANASRIAAGVNYLADTDKLRKVLAQNFLITAAYRCSKLAVQAATLKTSYWHFALQAKTEPLTMAGNLDVLEKLALISDAQKRDSLSGVADYGRTTFYLNADYDEALMQSLFFHPDGRPRQVEEYELIGRNALRLLLHPGDDDYRLQALANDSTWKQVKETGGTLVNLHTLFPNLSFSAEIPIIAGDFVLIEWWATTMVEMAASLAAVQRLLSQDPAPSPNSPEFKKVQGDLWHEMGEVAKYTHDRFAEPWGFLAMDLASGQQAKVRAQITSPRLALILERPARPAIGGMEASLA